MSPLNATNASFIMGFIVFVSRQDMASQYGKGHNIFVTRGIWPISKHWIVRVRDERVQHYLYLYLYLLTI